MTSIQDETQDTPFAAPRCHDSRSRFSSNPPSFATRKSAEKEKSINKRNTSTKQKKNYKNLITAFLKQKA